VNGAICEPSRIRKSIGKKEKQVIFEEFEIATYFLDMECANCGSMATAPTLLDREIQE
jgi:hypothetical protein